jgi:ribosome-binding factor A
LIDFRISQQQPRQDCNPVAKNILKKLVVFISLDDKDGFSIMPQFRKERVSELLKQTMSDIIRDDIKDPRVHGVTITEISLSSDLKSARVFFSSLDDGKAESHSQGLAAAEGFIRRRLKAELDLKYIPVMTFSYDSSFDHLVKISNLLKEIEPVSGDQND